MIVKVSEVSSGSMFYGTTINATPKQFIDLFGSQTRKSGDGKVSMIWDIEIVDLGVFTIYDWKYYSTIDENEEIIWNICGLNKDATEKAKKELLTLLNK